MIDEIVEYRENGHGEQRRNNPGQRRRQAPPGELPALGQALSSLPPKRRDVVLLFYFADQNEPQIGRLLNITTMAVNARRRKALAALRELLEVEYGA